MVGVGVVVRGGEGIVAGERECGMRTQCGWGKRAKGAEAYVMGEVGGKASVGCCCLFAHVWWLW